MARGHPDWGALPAYYDRPLSVAADEFEAIAAPHAETLRLSYTAPSGRVAYVELISMSMVRDTAPTTASWFDLYVRLLRPNAPLRTMVMVTSRSGSVDGGRTQAVGSLALLRDGDGLRFYTLDVSTGGSVRYNAGYKLSEF